MKAVIKQDFLRRRSGVLISSLVLFLLNAFLIIMTLIANKSKPGLMADVVNQLETTGSVHVSQTGLWSFLEIITPIIVLIDTFGVFFWSLEQGASNIGKDLRSDVGYLYKMVPRSGWSLLGGKLILGLAEFLFYAIQSFIYLLILDRVSSIDSSGMFVFTWNDVRMAFIMNNFSTLLTIVAAVMMQFILGATLVGFASITGTAFFKNRRFRGPLVAVGIFALVILVGRVTGNVFSSVEFETMRLIVIWLGLLIEFAFSAVFYVLSCILWEKKVSV
ncbi:MAG: hypothetical protein J5647_05480 [Spirochaetaceae bacterium]|nr:hypothetical protein [Spirochaetaceae bacterium]